MKNDSNNRVPANKHYLSRRVGWIVFIFMLGIAMVAAPGVPGGAIMAALGLLQSMLGFDETAQGLMIALYIAMDSFGTACNVTGDGAIAVIMDRINKKSHHTGTREELEEVVVVE